MPMPQFYSMAEVAEKLGKSEDDVKALVRDGKLREFRDRGQVFFKAEEVDDFVDDAGGGTSETLSLDDSSVGGLALSEDSALGDSAIGASNAGGSAFGDSSLGESALGDSAIGASHAGTSAGTPAKEPAPDVGSSPGEYDLSGDSGAAAAEGDSSVGLSDGDSTFDLSDSAGGSPIDLADESVDATEEPDLLLDTGDSLTLKDDELGEGDKGDTVITSVGISVFDDDEIEIDVDPMAKTQVQPSLEDQISLEGVGSGSGLLDLTRESDDTSLGAELLDEIYPGEEESTMQEDLPTEVLPGVTDTPTPAAAGFTPAGAPGYAVVVQAPPDPISVGFTGMMIVGVLMLCLTGTILAAALQGVSPSFMTTLYSQWMAVAGGGVGLAVFALLIGWFVGNQMHGGGASKPKEPRKKKEKKKKKGKKSKDEEPEEPTEAEAGDDGK